MLFRLIFLSRIVQIPECLIYTSKLVNNILSSDYLCIQFFFFFEVMEVMGSAMEYNLEQLQKVLTCTC